MPPLARSNAPSRLASAPVNAPLTWPNSSDSMRLGATARAVEDDERALAARRRLVNRARHDVFAAAGLAADEDREVGRRDALEHAEDFAHAHRAADDITERMARADRDLLGATVVGQEADARLAHGDRRARVQEALFDRDVTDTRTVERAEVAQEPALVGLAQLTVEARSVLIFDHHVIGRAGADANVRHAQYQALLGAIAGHHDQAGCMVGRRVARLDRDGRRTRGVAGHFANTSTTTWGFSILGFSEPTSGFRRDPRRR